VLGYCNSTTKLPSEAVKASPKSLALSPQVISAPWIIASLSPSLEASRRLRVRSGSSIFLKSGSSELLVFCLFLILSSSSDSDSLLLEANCGVEGVVALRLRLGFLTASDCLSGVFFGGGTL